MALNYTNPIEIRHPEQHVQTCVSNNVIMFSYYNYSTNVIFLITVKKYLLFKLFSVILYHLSFYIKRLSDLISSFVIIKISDDKNRLRKA